MLIMSLMNSNGLFPNYRKYCFGIFMMNQKIVAVKLYYCRAGKFWINSEFYPKLSGMSKNRVIGHQFMFIQNLPALQYYSGTVSRKNLLIHR